MDTELETSCDTPGCRNRVRRYPWNSDHRRETRYCIPCALERQQLAEGAITLSGGKRSAFAGEELKE